MKQDYAYLKRWREAHPEQLKEHKQRSNKKAYEKVKEWNKITRALGRIQIYWMNLFFPSNKSIQKL